MKRTLLFLALLTVFCLLVGELVFSLLPRQTDEIELPDIHFKAEP